MNLQSNRRIKRAWAFYDWANSVYSLVIGTAIFPIFFNAVTEDIDRRIQVDPVSGNTLEVSYVSFLGMEWVNTQLYGYAISFMLLIVAVISPILSGVADYAGKKKFFLRLFCYLGSAACVGLWWFDVEALELSMGVFVLAGIGFWASLVFYNSYLPDIAPKEEHDRLSAHGFALGYAGSVILLIAVLVLSQGFGMDIRYAFLMVGLWWFGFAQITLSRIPENPYNHGGGGPLFSRGFKELRIVAWDAWNARRLWWYLLSFLMMSMAVQTIMVMAQFFGIKEVWRTGENGELIRGMDTTQLIVAIILVQIIAIPGAYLFSGMAKRWGNVSGLKVAMLLWISVCVFAYAVVDTPTEFWIAACFIGFIMGGTQSLTRSTYSKFLPETEDTTSYFSFYDVLEKVGIVIGTACFGYIEGLTGTMRNSVLALVAFFLIALVLLFVIPKTERFLKPREELKYRKTQRGTDASE